MIHPKTREIDSDHPGELNGGGVLLFSENPLDRIGMTATGPKQSILNQPVRVMDMSLSLKNDIQEIKGVRETRGGERQRSRA